MMGLMEILLSRDLFRERVLSRNKGFCCVPNCSQAAVDAHHILNRNLFTEETEYGGYFLSNGAQLCNDHHYKAELTIITVEELREYCQIEFPAIPKKLDPELSYDCWGNIILKNGFRKPGLLFNNEGCQKALKTSGLLWKFSQ